VWGAARLVEQVRIGQFDGPDEYTFGSVAAIATGPAGTLYVLDREPPSLRAYASDGTFLRQLAGEGEGPGELKQPDSGLAILPDGRILARDPGNARITVFGAEGEYETEWRIRGSSFTSTPLYTDRAGSAYVQLFEFFDDRPRFKFVRYGPDGEPADTVEVPRERTPRSSSPSTKLPTARTHRVTASHSGPTSPRRCPRKGGWWSATPTRTRSMCPARTG